MRFIIYGAGGIGGSIGARLFMNGEDVLLIARGEHGKAIQAKGLQFHSPKYHETLKIEAALTPAEVDFQPNDVLILCMKSQQTEDALRDLQKCTPDDIPIVCCQNGVANERMAVRRFSNVYGMVVWVPTEHLEPGVVVNFAEDRAGGLDAGCYPFGVDELITKVTGAIDAAGFSAQSDPNIMEAKYAKLLVNLTNACDAASHGRLHEVSGLLQAEGRTCFKAAGVKVADLKATQTRRSKIRGGQVDGFDRHGSSTLQSMLRDTVDIESDYMNGEIVQLGRLHGIPTPANVVVQRLGIQLVNRQLAINSLSEQEILQLIEAEKGGEHHTHLRH